MDSEIFDGGPTWIMSSELKEHHKCKACMCMCRVWEPTLGSLTGSRGRVTGGGVVQEARHLRTLAIPNICF